MEHKEFVRKLSKKRPEFFEEYELLEEYRGCKDKITIKHKKCGKVFLMDPMHLMRGQGCPHCHGGKKDKAWFNEKMKDLVGDEYLALEDYTTGKTKIKFKHVKCGEIFEMRPEDFLNGQRCPECAKHIRAAKLKKEPSIFAKEVASLVGDEYELLSDYTNCKEKVWMKHKTCGSIFKVSPTAFLHGGSKKTGTRCPICFASYKKSEDI